MEGRVAMTGGAGKDRAKLAGATDRKPKRARRGGSDGQELLPGLDSPLLGDVKADRATMVFGFFSLKRERVTELPVYDDGTVRIEVTGTKHGVATMFDKEIIVYIVSLMQHQVERGEKVEQTFSFSVHDFCRIAGITPSGTAYERIEGALVRLQGTQVRTNIAAGGQSYSEGFSWVEKYRINREGGRMRSITVRLCDWIWRTIALDRSVLSYDAKYFDLPPLERRLYEIARVHCVGRTSFRISLETLKNRVGSTQELKTFRSDLGRVLKKDSMIPGFSFRIETGSPDGRRASLSRASVVFWNIHHGEPAGDVVPVDDRSLDDVKGSGTE